MKLLLYCTKAKPYLYRQDDDTFKLENKIVYEDISDYKKYYGLNNGKIVAECDFEVEEIHIGKSYGFPRNIEVVYTDSLKQPIYLEEKTCMAPEQICEYLNHKGGYAIHIKNLHIFDKPRFIQDYSKNENPYNYIENAPQNMMYAYDVKSFKDYEKYILISIRPEWLCKILNGEKTIEIRKKVLKELKA